MLNRDALAELYRELRPEKVLSVYLNGKTNDFSERNVWRRRLEVEISEARKRVNGAAPDESALFDKALERVKDQLDEFDQFLPDRGWVGFATQDRLVHAEAVRVPMPDLVRWEEGIRVAPYVRALKQDRPVVTALVDSQRARIFEYRGGGLAEVHDLNADTFLGDLSDINVSKRPTSRSGVRGKTGSDAAKRSLAVSSERMMKHLAEILTEQAGADGLVVVGGSAEAIAALQGQLPSQLGSRTIERPSMNLEMKDAEIRKGVEAAASQINQDIQGRLLEEVVDLARSGGRGALGARDVEEALGRGSVDTLLLSRGFIKANTDYADHLVGAAFEQHADVEELSFEGGARLDSEGEGVAARLRFTVES